MRFSTSYYDSYFIAVIESMRSLSSRERDISVDVNFRFVDGAPSIFERNYNDPANDFNVQM